MMPNPLTTPRALNLSRMGGSEGCKARAEDLTTERLAEIGRKGAVAGGRSEQERPSSLSACDLEG